MPRQLKKNCYTCYVAAMTAINSTVCDGWRSRDGFVSAKPIDCQTWRMAADVWSITEATAFAAFIGFRMSKPTVTKLCRKAGALRRKPNSIHYIVNASVFRLEILKHREEF